MRPRLFVDSDGVVANFDLQFFRMHGKWPHQVTDDELWRLIHSDFRFWSEMPLYDGALEFWAAIRHLDPVVLTGCHKDNYDAISAEKIVFWKEKFAHEQVITCLSKNKAFHMERPGDVLIDDMSKNIKRWEKAGGIGIVHKTFAQTLDRLREIGLL